MPIAEQNIINSAPCGDEIPQWFAMRATYHREMAVKQLLDNAGIECYLPMTQKVKLSNGRKVRVSVPLVSSLIFVKCVKERLQRFKARVPHLQYITQRREGKNEPIVVPVRQMDEFIAVTQSESSRLLFYRPDEVDLGRGTLVRIHGGAFDGVTGAFIKLSGKRNKRVVIEVQGVIAVALECSDANFVEVL